MRGPIRLGIIIPSSNTSAEPLSQAIVSSISTEERPITVHFTRISVTTLNLSPGSKSQFTPEALLAAAQLLADAKVQIIGWSGTSGGWLGFENDRNLCNHIEERLGIPMTTSTLGLNKVLACMAKFEKLGLVTPYSKDVQDVIVRNYTELGYPITNERERHLSVADNIKIAAVDEAKLHQMITAVVAAGADVVTTFCTNWNAAHLVGKWEKEFGVPIFDSVATVVWDMCNILQVDMGNASHWGKMFEQ
ncbi:hypothetical protein BLS_006410 [Venturia inaequalis]|uniref:Asp/Glu racemase n=1 Tax=Venturia inaequalis TaxID=5025 RepID=A0A8H3UC27_VENIN|nr:hypothetical protein BLS_006410 [Venturia inaequalis]KAE9990115.1 hypothetical protein EG327_001845 [Venturia inaequalis]RDI79346.1 hypothetical protein Vi05172_g10578 [Venturia inaequalis]